MFQLALPVNSMYDIVKEDICYMADFDKDVGILKKRSYCRELVEYLHRSFFYNLIKQLKKVYKNKSNLS
jgi:hypothetical protein